MSNNTQQEEWEEELCECNQEGSTDNAHYFGCNTLLVRDLLLQARKEAREEMEKQCKANCDANYNMGYAKGIATHVNIDLIKREAKIEMLTDIEQSFQNGREETLREVIEMVEGIKEEMIEDAKLHSRVIND